jgi:hypothetical protein
MTDVVAMRTRDDAIECPHRVDDTLRTHRCVCEEARCARMRTSLRHAHAMRAHT